MEINSKWKDCKRVLVLQGGGAIGAPDALSFYDTAPLRSTLEKLVDLDLINNGNIRLSVGAVNIATGNQIVVDNTKGGAKGRQAE